MESNPDVEKKDTVAAMGPLKTRYPAGIRIGAKIISFIFHPLFIPVYLSWLIVKTQSFLFSSFSNWDKTIFILRFGVMYLFFPLVSVLLMKALGFVSSIRLKTQRDRIIPYIACMIYYWWMWYVLHNLAEFPKDCVALSLAIFLASVGGLMANIRMKVSMHAMAAGVMVAFVMLLGFSQDASFGIYISIAILLTGIICSARLIDGGHNAREVYWGLFIGIASLIIATNVT